jgi:hypothetical protein
MRPLAWIVFILICVVAFFLAILPVTSCFAFFLMGCGMEENAVPVAFVIAAVGLIGSIVWGILDQK